MPYDSSPRVLAAAVDRIRRESKRPASMGAAAPGAISLAMGEPSEGTPGPITAAAVNALHDGRTRYSPLAGSPTLQVKIAQHLSARHDIEVVPEQVVCTHGASAGLAAAIVATVNPGDRVVVPEPTYSLYADHVAMVGGHIVWVANRADGSIDVERVEAELTGARMLILCSPGNPTGMVIGSSELQQLSAAAEAAGAYLLCDEAYSDIVFDGLEFPSSLDLARREHVICAQTFSKTYAMTGWRLGWVTAAPEVAAAINLVHRTFVGALNTFVQDAGVVALETRHQDLQRLAASYQARRDLVLRRLEEAKGISVVPPQGAFYAFVRSNSSVTSDELVAQMAEQGVLVRSGREFGPSGEGAFRISFATGPKQLDEGMSRIVRVLQGVTNDVSR